MSSKGMPLAVAVALVLLIALIAWTSGVRLVPRSPDERVDAARGLLDGIRIRPTVTSVDLVAGGAIADDFEQGVRLVRVRMVERLELELLIEADHDVAFGVPPQLCLVGPDSAPDDAGLENRCWGMPDLSAFLAARLTADAMGHPLLRAGDVVTLKAVLSRGPGIDNVDRCDYAPGSWLLEFSAAPLVDGVHLPPMTGPGASLEVPIPSQGPLRLLRPDQTRYCGLASRIYREQGEPPVITPEPSS
jgi:hypothetical protein